MVWWSTIKNEGSSGRSKSGASWSRTAQGRGEASRQPAGNGTLLRALIPVTHKIKRTMEQAMDVAEIRSKIDEYSSFISSTLRPQLEAAVKAREEVELDIKEYEALQAKLANIEEKKGQSVKDTVVDLGHELIYCKAAIDDPSRIIYVHAGMGFHVEMTIDEARTFVGKRIALLKQSLELKTHKATTIAVHIEDTILVLQQLGNEASLSQEE